MTTALPSRNSFFSRNIWIGVVFLLLSIAPGLWGPAIVNILDTYGAKHVLPYTLAIGPAVAIFSTLIFASLADRKYEAQKLFGMLSISGAIFLWLSFASLEWGWSPWYYVFFQGCNALIAGPMWALLAKVALVHSKNPEKDFPLFRLWGTVGWIIAGVLVSFWALDASAEAGKLAAIMRIFIGLAAFMMPRTFPVISGVKPTWAEKLGLSALTLLKDKRFKVYFITLLMLTIPLVSFYMYVPKMLRELALIDKSDFALQVQTWLPGASAQMTLGQMTEVVAMLLMSWWGVRARVKWLVVLALCFGVARFVCFAFAGQYGLLPLLWLGISMHGPCYVFFSITGQMFVDRQVAENMRAQAQALLSLVTSVGGIMGPLMIGLLYHSTADEKAMGFSGWVNFWWILVGVVIICLVYFTLNYKSRQGTVITRTTPQADQSLFPFDNQ